VAGPQATPETPGAFWKGMRLLALDGTVESLPDTPSNRESFRYSTDDELSHSPFPQARLVLVVECATHLICDAEISPCRQAEASSTRLLLERGQWEHTLVLWDSGFHCSGAIFQLRASGGHVLGRLKSNVLLKPWCHLSDGSYLTYIYQDQEYHSGERMLVRVISYTFTDPRIAGAGQQVYRLVTTLLDPKQVTKDDLAELYRARWNNELDLRSIKSVMQMRELRCKTPELVRKEIWAHVLAYNLIRTVMAQAAAGHDAKPRSISFKATLQVLEAFRPLIAFQGHRGAAHRAALYQQILRAIAVHRVADRPDRFEPRMAKRRPKRYDRLTRPRQEIKRQMIKGVVKI